MLQDKARSAGFVFTAMDGGYAGPLSAIHGLRGTGAPARRNAGAISGGRHGWRTRRASLRSRQPGAMFV